MAETLTPMMQQYQAVRRSLPPDTFLLFRLGDFYELFFDDAKEAAGILNVALTKRGQTPMCGVPYHAAENYIAKLVKAGKRVAICDQTTEARPGKIVDREVTQIISPGTTSDPSLLEAKRPNYVAALHPGGGRFGFAYVDLSTGEFRLTELENLEAVANELARVAPAELLVSEEEEALRAEWPGAVGAEPFSFAPEQASFVLREHFKVQALDGFGCADLPAAIGAAGAILYYLRDRLRRKVQHVTRLTCYRTSHFMLLDAATQANLELVTSRGDRDGSLLRALDRTLTPMGGRALRDWILHPLTQLAPLWERQEAIAELLAEPFILSELREKLRAIRDLERTMSRLSQGSGNARDLAALAQSLAQVPALVDHLEALRARVAFGSNEMPASLLTTLTPRLEAQADLVERIQRALVDEPPAPTREGGMFRDGFDAALDQLRGAGRHGQAWIAALQQREIEATGIKSLKVRYTSVFGYFIEITNSNLAGVPEHYQRRQTTVGGERFTTPELKEMEHEILGAEERARHLEYELFTALRGQALDRLEPVQELARALAELDVIGALAETARLYSYCRPLLNDGLKIEIRDGRHPVLDQSLLDEKFVPNDLQLDGQTHRLLLITGPNMAGKSTFIRQTALLVLLAQIGSYLPAASAEIGLADRVFTRVGASDDLSRGQSTFMVEMNETANILNNATARSLVILDEIGRGTSTFDGLAIAWSVCEFLHDELGARTLFATHYHELTELELTRPGVKNFHAAVREWNDQIIFLRKIVRGGADQSYGIQVARLAGLPPAAIARAREILRNLEASELNADGKPALAEVPSKKTTRLGRPAPTAERPQMSLFPVD